MKDKKVALILTGGSAAGAFQIGALDYLQRTLDYKFDIITGVSVGALNASFLAQYKKGEDEKAVEDLMALWLSIKTENIHKRWFTFGKLAALWKKSLYNSEPLRKLIEENVDLERIKTSGKKLQIGTVSVDHGDYKSFDENSEDLVNAIKASAAFPLFLTPVHVSEPGTLDFDGAIREVAPLHHAIDMDADEIIFISATDFKVGNVKASEMKTLSITERFIKILHNEVVKNDVENFIKINNWVKEGKLINTDKKYIPITIIKPEGPLLKNTLEFKPSNTAKLFVEGYEAAKKALKK